MRTGSIYIIRNTVNSKVYVGQTTMSVHARFMTHMKPSTLKLKRNYKLYNAVQKYGRNAFFVETLEEKVPLDIINEREIYYIQLYDSYVNGYNSTKGGDGRIFNKLDNEDEIIQLAKSGHSVQEISEKFGVSRATISRTLSRLNVKMYNRISEKQLKTLVAQGISNKEIATMFCVDTDTVMRSLKRHGMGRYRTRISKRDINLEAVRKDYEEQMPISDICEKYEISRTTFYRIKETFGGPCRPQVYKNKIRYY